MNETNEEALSEMMQGGDEEPTPTGIESMDMSGAIPATKARLLNYFTSQGDLHVGKESWHDMFADPGEDGGSPIKAMYVKDGYLFITFENGPPKGYKGDFTFE